MTDVTQRLSAALSDRYRIQRELGQGGMATVYLAQDLRHDRKVAIKVLKPELAAVLGAERFVQEIKTTAALSHPHILPLFDSGTADGFLFYVMPYIQGETIREKLNRESQFGIDVAVKIASEVADALDYAHRNGVIHRDIKPENILLHDGRPMVMDFGIALAVSAAAGGRMTETGLSLGTPHYMSPEQATADKDITGRSDIYSLASVLYEMLTGEPPHMGNTAQQIIMKIITDTPRPVTELRKSVPANIAAAVAKALEKLPADRFESARAFADALGNPTFSTARPGTAAYSAQRGVSQRAFAGIAAVAVLAVVAALFGWMRPGAPAAQVVRYEDAQLANDIVYAMGGAFLALSPDGAAIAYRSGSTAEPRIYVRQRDQLTATVISGSEGGSTPFFSRDGKQIAFCVRRPSAGACSWKMASLGGGPSTTIADNVGFPDGASWGTDGMIYVGSAVGLLRIPTSGGQSKQLTVVDTAAGEQSHRMPAVLPGSQGILFIASTTSGYRLAAADAKGKHSVFSVQAVSATYVEPGYVAYVTLDGTLMAAPFDTRRLAITGEARVIAEGIGVRFGGRDEFEVSATGTLMYGASESRGRDEVAWVNRDGGDRVADSWLADFGDLALSPDGALLAVTIRQLSQGANNSSPVPVTELWVKQGEKGALSRLTLGSDGGVSEPRWTADSKSIVFIQTRDGRDAIWTRRADGSAPAGQLFSWDRAIETFALAPDGALLIDAMGSQGRDIFLIRPGVDSVPKPLISEPMNQTLPSVSPDGRWVAYVSNETGRSEIYVRPYPDVNAWRVPVTSQGASRPGWSRSARELLYSRRASLQGEEFAEMRSVTVTPGSPIGIGEDRALFKQPLGIAYWGASPDGARFAIVRPQPGTQSFTVIVVENWIEELKRKMR